MESGLGKLPLNIIRALKMCRLSMYTTSTSVYECLTADYNCSVKCKLTQLQLASAVSTESSQTHRTRSRQYFSLICGSVVALLAALWTQRLPGGMFLCRARYSEALLPNNPCLALMLDAMFPFNCHP